ncbi:MAG: DUF2599 domain-containing protein [Anaerotignum sp.]|nr:DUF2599 domain-containing protein [Anaerotignum sp.]
MKNAKRLVCLALTALMLLGNAVTAAAATQTNEFEYLKGAIETIDAVPSEEINQYIEDNREWIDEIGVRLDAYLETIPEEQQHDTITRLLGGNPMARLSGNLDEYFNSVVYHYRGDYWTYSLDPKWSVRLWGPTMEAAWAELGNNYSGIRNDNGSLWNQYRCHWDYDVLGLIAGDWDLEVGRPLVPYSDMFAARCNP